MQPLIWTNHTHNTHTTHTHIWPYPLSYAVSPGQNVGIFSIKHLLSSNRPLFSFHCSQRAHDKFSRHTVQASSSCLSLTLSPSICAVFGPVRHNYPYSFYPSLLIDLAVYSLHHFVSHSTNTIHLCLVTDNWKEQVDSFAKLTHKQ